MKKYIFQPFKLLYLSRYELFLPILTRAHREISECSQQNHSAAKLLLISWGFKLYALAIRKKTVFTKPIC